MLTLQSADLLLCKQVPHPNTICVVGCEEQSAALGEAHRLNGIETCRCFVKEFAYFSKSSQVPQLDRKIFIADCDSIYILRHELDGADSTLVQIEYSEAGISLSNVPYSKTQI